MTENRRSTRAVNYWSSYGQITALSSARYSADHFDGQTNGLLNELSSAVGPAGMLPDDRPGEIVGIFFGYQGKQAAPTAGTDIEDRYTLQTQLRVDVHLNNVRVIEGAPVWCYCHPPLWVAGHQDATAGVDTEQAQNGGYMLNFHPLPWPPRTRLKVVVRTAEAITTQATVDYFITVQTVDDKPVMVA